jgi:hypothetical protein
MQQQREVGASATPIRAVGESGHPDPLAVAVFAPPSSPLVAMITVAAATTITALKIRNLAVLDAGTTSSESWLIEASKLAWKIAQ